MKVYIVNFYKNIVCLLMFRNFKGKMNCGCNVFGFGLWLKVVYMFKDDFDMMMSLVFFYLFKEIGGNLFGLWIDE